MRLLEIRSRITRLACCLWHAHCDYCYTHIDRSFRLGSGTDGRELWKGVVLLVHEISKTKTHRIASTPGTLPCINRSFRVWILFLDKDCRFCYNLVDCPGKVGAALKDFGLIHQPYNLTSVSPSGLDVRTATALPRLEELQLRLGNTRDPRRHVRSSTTWTASLSPGFQEARYEKSKSSVGESRINMHWVSLRTAPQCTDSITSPHFAASTTHLASYIRTRRYRGGRVVPY